MATSLVVVGTLLIALYILGLVIIDPTKYDANDKEKPKIRKPGAMKGPGKAMERLVEAMKWQGKAMERFADLKRYLGKCCTQSFLDKLDENMRAGNKDSASSKARRRINRNHRSYGLLLFMAARSHIPSAPPDPSPFGRRHLFYVPNKYNPAYWWAVGSAYGSYSVQRVWYEGEYQYRCSRWKYAKWKHKRTEMPAWDPRNPFYQKMPDEERWWNDDSEGWSDSDAYEELSREVLGESRAVPPCDAGSEFKQSAAQVTAFEQSMYYDPTLEDPCFGESPFVFDTNGNLTCMAAAPKSKQAGANFDTDSGRIGIDNRATSCMSPYEGDFVGELVETRMWVEAFDGAKVHTMFKGTIEWRILTDEGVEELITIPDAY